MSGGDLSRDILADSNVTEQVVAGLKPSTTYAIAVRARTVKGFGPPTEITGSTRPPPRELVSISSTNRVAD